MAIKKFVVEFDIGEDRAASISRLNIWEALRDYFVDGLYIQVEEISPTTGAVDSAEIPEVFNLKPNVVARGHVVFDEPPSN